MSNPLNWTLFLKDYAAALRTQDWPGNLGASEDQLSTAEERLKVALPPSYRAFLSASNGWRQTCESVPILRSVEKIKWFRKEHREWVDAYVGPQQGMESPLLDVDYFSYVGESSAKFDANHLAQTLCISEVGDSAVLLLNPMAVWPDGEWEAWFFANWIPGAIRYRSFAEWMRHEFAKLRDEPFEPVHAGEWPTVFRDGPTKPQRRILKREEIPPLGIVLKNLISAKDRVRVKATKYLSRIGGKEAIQGLLTALKDDPEPNVRCEAAEALGRLRTLEAIDALVAAVDDHGVNSTAVVALGRIDDERASQFLLSLVESNHYYGGVASYALAQRGDDRGVPLLVSLLLSKEPQNQHTGNIAGRLIAQYRSEAAYLALEPLMNSPDREIRSRAISGIFDLSYDAKDQSIKIKARELLQRCQQTETDEELRRWIEVSIEVIGTKKPNKSEC